MAWLRKKRNRFYIVERKYVVDADICEACEIVTRRKVEGRSNVAVIYGFHSLRHTHVTLAREHGASLDDLAKTVGHGAVAMTSHYDQAGKAAAKRVAEVLPKL